MANASAARIAANKANAQRSTGPRTPEGKAAVANNAFKHGLRSERNPLDLSTDSALAIEREEFLTTLAAFKEDLHPHGPIETRLVERLAQIDLRLQRAVRLETTHLENKFHETVADAKKAGSPAATDTSRTRDNWILMFAFLRDPAALKLISQYESRLARDFSRTLNELRYVQRDKRTGPQAPLCAVNEKPREQSQYPKSAPTPTPGLASDGQVAPLPPTQSTHPSPTNENPSEQTQPASVNQELARPNNSSKQTQFLTLSAPGENRAA